MQRTLCIAPLLVASAAALSFSSYILGLQQQLCNAAAELDGSGQVFCQDSWRNERGHGVTRVLEGGDVIAKGAISTTILEGQLDDERAKAMSQRGRKGAVSGARYRAAALSLVLHSARPAVPTLRSDIRLFALEGEQPYYGGGVDLTPFLVNEDDFRDFHASVKALCNRHGEGLYEGFKKECDEGEHRGVGGIFFDDLEALTPEASPEAAEAFVRDLGENFIELWRPVVQRRRHEEATETQREWQEMRRGRYLEFNLLYDRGVRFGLSSGPSRIEAIMVSGPRNEAQRRLRPRRANAVAPGDQVSAPPVIRWNYMGPGKAEPDEEEAGGSAIRSRVAAELPEEERRQREDLLDLLSSPPRAWA
eukprot:scaffold2926_cov247-Pinguiococcus_pyrenoidosus.AAC.12